MSELHVIPRSLHEWMNIATRDLCDKAKGRLYAEYGAHYADAVEVMAESGMPRAEAESTALAGLGDPKKARRALNRIHLTRNDIIYLQKRIKPDKAPEGWRETVKAFVKFSIYMIFMSYMFAWQLVLACSVIIAVNRNLVTLHPKWISLRAALTVTAMLDFIVWVIILVMNGAYFKTQAFWAFAVMLFCAVMADSWRSFTIICKLGRSRAVADDFEPPRMLGA